MCDQAGSANHPADREIGPVVARAGAFDHVELLERGEIAHHRAEIARRAGIGFANQRDAAIVEHTERAVLRDPAIVVAEAAIDESGGLPYGQRGGLVGLRAHGGETGGLAALHGRWLGLRRHRIDRASLVRLLDDRAGDIDHRQVDQRQRLGGKRSGDKRAKGGNNKGGDSEHGNYLPSAHFPPAHQV